MALRHRKYSLPLLLSVFLLCVYSVHASAIAQQFAEEKSPLASTRLPHIGATIQTLRESIRFWSSGGANRHSESNQSLLHSTRRIRTMRSDGDVRQSDTSNFVIFVSSPGKNGHLIPIPPTADKDSRQLDNDKEPRSSNTEAVTILSGQPAGSGPGQENVSNSRNGTNSGSQVPKSNPSPSSSSGDHVPEADVYLDVTTGSGNPNNSISIQPIPEDEIPESTVDVELTVIDPSSEEISTSEGSLSIDNDDGNGSYLDKESNSDYVKPQPSVASGPEEQPVILIPPDTDDDENSQEPEDIESNVPIESAISEATTGESSVLTEATPESENPTPHNVNAASPLKAERKPSFHLKDDQPRPEGAKGAAILVDVPLSVSSSEQSISPEFDSHTRNYLGETTGTAASKWKPTRMSTMVRTIQRQDGYRWEVKYQGKLIEATARRKVDKLEKDINEGAMDSYLKERMSTEVRVRTTSTPLVDAPKGDEISLTEMKETSSGTAGTNSEGKGRSRNLGVILGTCFGLVGALVLAAGAFTFVRRRGGKEEHFLDGMATVPTTVSSFQSDMGESEVRTGAPMKPRGPTVLRNQSRIVDW